MHAIPLVLVLFTANPAATAPAAPKPSDAPKSPALQQIEAAVLRKEWKEVSKLSSELSAREPKNADGAYWQGVAALNLGQLDVAIEQLTRSLGLEERTKGHYNLGMAFAMRGEVEKALPHFQRSVAMSPKYKPGWEAVAQAQLQLGDAQTAGESLLRALELSPADPELLSLGLSIADAQRAKRYPPEALRHHERGAVFAASGDAAQAKSEFAQALALAPEFADCHYNLGVIARREGDLAKAEREYRTAISSFLPTEGQLRADAQNNLADLLLAKGKNGAEARTLVDAAIATRGERASYLDTRARACDALGDAACARESFEKLLAAPQPIPSEVRTHAEQRLKALSAKK